MSQPAVFDQNMVNSWFFHHWKEQNLSFKTHILKNLFDQFKGFKTEFSEMRQKRLVFTGYFSKSSRFIAARSFSMLKRGNQMTFRIRVRCKNVQLNRFWFSRHIYVSNYDKTAPKCCNFMYHFSPVASVNFNISGQLATHYSNRLQKLNPVNYFLKRKFNSLISLLASEV